MENSDLVSVRNKEIKVICVIKQLLIMRQACSLKVVDMTCYCLEVDKETLLLTS